MKSLNDFMVFSERTMTTKEKSKEDRLKDKYDDSSMKNNMKDQYGEEEGEKVYYATIRKQAMKKEEVEVEEGVIDAVKKGAKRHAKAVQAKKIKDRKAVPYAALAAENELEGEELKEYSPNVTYQAKGGKKSGKLGKSSVYSLRDKDESKKEFRKSQVKDIKGGYLKTEEKKKGLDGKECWDGYKLAGTKKKGGKTVDNCVKVKEDYYSGTGEKVQKRTLAWMRKKGQKGAPGLDAMKAREAEHKSKRGVKEEAGCETKKIENKGKKKIDPNKNPVVEAKVDQGRSDYGKASIRNYRHSGPDTVDPAMFDPENKRGKTIDKRREEHKARRGKKGAKVPTYKKESFSDWRTDLGEEGYDRMRDDRLVKYGIGHDGSDRKGSTSRPTGKQPKGKTVLQKETEKKYGKGVSALDVVKAKIRDKHGKDAIMKPKK